MVASAAQLEVTSSEPCTTLLPRASGYDAIIIETTGLADPGPVAQTFFVDPVLQERTTLDSITTLVDARHIPLRLKDSRDARQQIAFADQIILNKIDLVPENDLAKVEGELRRINALAPIYRAVRAEISLDKILGRHAFDLHRITTIEPEFLSPSDHHHHHHDHDSPCELCADEEEAHPHHPMPAADTQHLSDIESVSLSSDKPMNQVKISNWLTELTATRGEDILRAKGIISVADNDRKLVFQAVHMLLEGTFTEPWPDNDPRQSRMVFIGRRLDRDALSAAFQACTA